MSEELLPLVISPPLQSLVPELPQLAALVTCSICYELQLHSTSTPCFHSFCSLCIRKYLQFKPQCPTCYTTVYEQNLKTDKTGQNVVQLIGPLVTSLEKLVSTKVVCASEPDLNDQKENLNPSIHNNSTDAISISKSATLPLSPVKSENTIIYNKPSPTTHTLKIKDESELLQPSSQQPLRTPCPVCYVSIPERSIKLHVDRCLSTRKASPPSQPVAARKRPALPKLVYALLKDSELKKKCREFGLNPKGDRKTLTCRLQKYTLLYNTESQLEKPRSKMEIVMQVEREEKEEKAGKVSTPALLQFDRKTDSGVIEKKQKQYIQENKDTFADLIKQVKARKKKITIKLDETQTAIDGFNLRETVESIEEVSSVVDKRGSIEDLTETELSDPVFHMPGPSKDAVGTSYINSQCDDSRPNNKRSLSPTFAPSSPPRKQTRPSSTAIYLTPKKSELEELARSPMKSQNIMDKLTQSSEQLKKCPKIACPVCSVGVTQKFLNIHLDKCLRVAEEPSPVFTRTKQRRKSKSTKPSVPDHLARIVIEDSEDSEASLMLNYSDFDDDSFASELIHSRGKHTRGVVKPSIVEISDDPEVIESKKPYLAEEAEFGEVSKNIHGDEAPKDILDLSTCPPSPIYNQYTDTHSQGSYVQSQSAMPGSDIDMFASGNEADVVGKDDLDTSRNLLEDFDDDIEVMMEAALSEQDENDKIQPEKFTKRVEIKIVPIQVEDKLPTKSTKTVTSTLDAQPPAPVVRSTRRTTRLRSKAKLI